MKDHEKRFFALLRPLFPEDATFIRIDENLGALTFRADWKLPAEGRPNRHARPIHVVIDENTLDDYEDAPGGEADRRVMDERMVRFVAAKLKAFDPEHSCSVMQRIPEEVWKITPDIVSV